MSSRIGLTARGAGRAPDADRRARAPRPPSRRPARTRSRACPRRGRPAGASPSARSRRRRPRRPLGDLEADAVVADVERHHVAHVRQRDADPRGVRVLGDVGQRLLGRPQQRDLDLGVERRPPRRSSSPRPGSPLIADQRCATSRERVGQGRRLQRLRPRRLDRAPRLGQALAGQPAGVVEVPVALRRGRSRACSAASSWVTIAGQALGDRVVDLAGHPLRARRGRPPRGPASTSWRVQPGVLRPAPPRAARPPAALLVLLGDPLAERPCRSRCTMVWMTMIDDVERPAVGVGREARPRSELIRIDVADDAERSRAAAAAAPRRGRSR